jgi:uncharacterized protein (DUF305 family)
MTRLPAITAAAALVLACSAQAADPSSSPSTTSAQDSQSTSMAMHHDMMSGMKEMHGMKPTGDADKDFAHMMEHHHAQAVKMTETYLKGAKNAQLKAWAEKSVKNQQKEIDELKNIQKTMGPSASTD